MENGKFFALLDTLTKEEEIRFADFIASPYHNSNKALIPVYTLIAKWKSNGEQIQKEKIFAAYFPGKKFEYVKFNNVIYYLNKLAESFIGLEKMQKDAFLSKMAIFSETRRRHLTKAAETVKIKLQAELNESPERDHNWYYKMFQFYNEQNIYLTEMDRMQDNSQIKLKTDNLDVFYFSAKLQDACEMMNRSLILPEAEYDNNIVGKIIRIIEGDKDKYEAYPSVSVYLCIFRMLSEKNNSPYFNKLTTLLSRHGKSFTHFELRDLYNYGRNYCIRRVNSGDINYMQSLFEINKTMVETGLLTLDNMIPEADYKNIVSAGLRIRQFEWVLQFIKKYAEKLPENERVNAFSYNLAYYNYESGDYKKATKLLNEVEFSNVFYNLDAKTLLLRIYFDGDEDESFLSLIAAFKNYLKRNKLIQENRYKQYHNLVKFTLKLFNLRKKLPLGKGRAFYKELNNIKHQIKETTYIANLNWLLSRVESLGK